MENHIISVRFNGKRSAIVPSKYYHDYRQVLRCEDIELPDTWELHIANDKNAAKAQVVLGSANGAEIPSSYFKSGTAIYCWIFLHDTEYDGETVYQIKIPILNRPEPDYEEPIEPEEESLITQAIAALNTAIDTTRQAVIETSENAESAQEDADRAETARDVAEGYVTTVNNAAERAETAASNAQTASENATLSASSARNSSESAAQSSASAHIDAEKAEEALRQIRDPVLYINKSNGHLIYELTDS